MRQRMIKPDFWSDEDMGKLSFGARLAYIASWNFADDEGRLRGAVPYLHGQIFPYDGNVNMSKLRDELTDAKKWLLYEVAGQVYIEIPRFASHQKIDRPQPSKIPPFRKVVKSRVRKNSTNDSTNDSTTHSSPNRSEMKLREEKLKTRERDGIFPEGFDTPEFQSAWGDWLSDRKARRKPVTPLAETQQLAGLAAMGHAAAIKRIRLAITNGWTGLIFEEDRKAAKIAQSMAATAQQTPKPSIVMPEIPKACSEAAIAFWPVVLERLAEALDPEAFETWFGSAQCRGVDSAQGQIWLAVPSEFFGNAIRGYRDALSEACGPGEDRDWRIWISVDESLMEEVEA